MSYQAMFAAMGMLPGQDRMLPIRSKGCHDDEIEGTHPAGLCALCDQPNGEYDVTVVIEAHGQQYLVHEACGLVEDEEDDEIE